MDVLTEILEANLTRYFEEGKEFAVSYQHAKYDDLFFYDTYTSSYEMSASKKYWGNRKYSAKRVYDLDPRTQRQRNRTRPKNRSTIG